MVLGQSGVILRTNLVQSIIAGVATGGSATTLVDTTKDFVALGVLGGDFIFIWDGSGLNQRIPINAVAATTLTFTAGPVAPASGSRYFIVRPTFVVLKGDIRIRHQHRTPVQDIPGRTGDVVQGLGRKSRRASMDAGEIYRGDIDSASRDAFHVADAQQLRTWSDAGTSLFLDTLTEANLKVRIEPPYEVVEKAGAKGFSVALNLVEVV